MVKLGVLDIEGTKYTLKLGETYLIGNKTDDYIHDIEIDDTSVDIKHCILDFTEKLPRLFDIRSKCGTFVDGIRVARCQVIPIVKSTTIQFGDVESTLQLLGEGDSGYLEGRLTPPTKDNSQIISNSPENVASSGSRLRQTLKNSLTSTPNATNTSNKSSQIATRIGADFLMPTRIPRRSTGSNTSARSVDSFCIPETQCPVENNVQGNNSTNVSIDTNKSNDKSTNTKNDDDDFFIPETQEVVAPSGTLSNYPRVAFGNEDINETIADNDKIPSSQFRICTQDFNGSGDDLSNNSDDILANVPCSIIIPAIRHEPVQIDDLLNPYNDEEDVEKEMSALQWSKRTGDDAEGSVTPDGIVPVDGVVTPDIIPGVEKETKEAASQCATLEESVNPEQLASEMIHKGLNTVNEASKMVHKSINTIDSDPEVTDHDVLPTQVFVKLPPLNRTAVKLLPLPCDKENIGPEKEESLFLPATQIFMAPAPKVRSVTLPPPPPPPPPPSSLPPPPSSEASSVHNDNDLPPTQVFQMAAPAATSSKHHCFSSTLVDSEMQLSESSFKAKCNKLLDSDDDEMDEVIAPELVKKMRQSLEKSEEPRKTLPTATIETAEAIDPLKSKVDVPVSKENPIDTPKEKFVAPAAVTKKNSCPQPAVSIDKFLYTPDFLGKEFSKDENLQKLAEVNWNNLISEKQRKSLFGDEDSDGNPVNSETDDSQDSFNDLLPHKEKKEQTTKSKPEKQMEKAVESKPSKEIEVGRITRRRKSAFPEESKEAKVPKKEILKDEPNKKAQKESKIKKELPSKKIAESADETLTKESQEKVKKSHKNTSDTDRPRLKARQTHHTDKTDREMDTSTSTSTSRRAESSSKNTKPQTSRTTRQSSYELKIDLDKFTKAKRHSESDDTSQSAPDKAAKHRNGFKYLKSKKKNGSIEENGIKTLRSSNKGTVQSSPKSTNSSGADKLAEKVSKRRKNETSRSKEPTKAKEKEEKPLPRLSRLRSGMNASPPKEKGDSTQLTITKIVPNLENNGVKTSKDGDEKPKKKSKKDDSTREQCSSAIDLTDSDAEDTSNKPPEPIKKTNSTNSNVSATMSVQNGKKKVEKSEPRIKRIRSGSSADSVMSSQSDVNRNSRSQKPKIKIAMTMCDPRYQEILEKHSGALWIYTKDPKECDVLVVEKGNRTYKLMVAIARGAPIVKLDWLVEVLKKKTIDIPFEQYIFEDPLFQERHQFHMKKSLDSARTTSLFDGMSFMMTPGIRPVPDEMKDIIICAGGTVLEHIPKAQPKQRIFLVSQPKDNQHWHRFRRANTNIKIVTSEGVMASVMQQSENPLIRSTIQ